jgi:hypothetical protein
MLLKYPRIPQDIIKIEDSLPCSRKPYTAPYPSTYVLVFLVVFFLLVFSSKPYMYSSSQYAG